MALQKKQRNLMPEQDPKIRAGNFEEVALGFDAQTAADEAGRCLNCKNAPCKKGCPVGVDIPAFLQALQKGDAASAGQIIEKTNSLPSVCGRVCPQENQCEKLCVRAKTDRAVAIGACERFAGDYMLLNEKAAAPVAKIGKKAAIAGSGPAGLTCAAYLADKGFEVTIFEAFHKSGGVLVYGIPEFRLPKSLVQAEINKLTQKGVKIEFNTVIGKTITIEELQSQYDAIFIGTGAGLPVFLNIPGENLNGVFSANEYLTRVNLMKAFNPESDTPIKTGKKAAVIGAGNVAMDAARTALRLGCESVSIIYRRGREEMPARAEEIYHAVEEGIKLELLTNPIEMIGENGHVKALKCVRMELSEPDASGRKSPKIIEGSEFIIEADMVIIALGTSPNPLVTDSCSQIQISKSGTITVDDNMQTTLKGVYAGGDAVIGAATVILAMGAGRKAGQAIFEAAVQNKLCL